MKLMFVIFHRCPYGGLGVDALAYRWRSAACLVQHGVELPLTLRGDANLAMTSGSETEKETVDGE